MQKNCSSIMGLSQYTDEAEISAMGCPRSGECGCTITSAFESFSGKYRMVKIYIQAMWTKARK